MCVSTVDTCVYVWVKGYKTINKKQKEMDEKEGREKHEEGGSGRRKSENSGPCHLRIIRAFTSQPPSLTHKRK